MLSVKQMVKLLRHVMLTFAVEAASRAEGPAETYVA